MLKTAKFIGLVAIRTIYIWILIYISTFAINKIYIYLTLRYKIIKLRSIVKGDIIIDAEQNTYQVLKNNIFGCSDLQNKIFKLNIESYYKVKIYGIDSPFTKVNIVDVLN